MLPELKYDDRGLIPAIIQDVNSGDVLMMAYMNRRSLEMTVESADARKIDTVRVRLHDPRTGSHETPASA
jgi:phosphoribosyl-AMP cyclohydrolase